MPDDGGKSLDEVYRERNLLALAFVNQYELYHSAAYGSEPAMGYWYDEPVQPRDRGTGERYVVVWVDTVEGQVGWHIPDDLIPPWLDERNPEYDGYTTGEKNDRVARLSDVTPTPLEDG